MPTIREKVARAIAPEDTRLSSDYVQRLRIERDELKKKVPKLERDLKEAIRQAMKRKAIAKKTTRALGLLKDCITRMRNESGTADPMHAFSFDAEWETWAKATDQLLGEP